MGDFDVKSLSSYNKVEIPSETKSLSPEDLKGFRDLANLYFSTDEDIQNMEKFIKERKKVRAQLTQRIMKFMADYDIEDLNTNKGCLVYSTTMKKCPLSETSLKKMVSKFFDNQHQAEAFMKHISSREEREINSLKVVRNKEDAS